MYFFAARPADGGSGLTEKVKWRPLPASLRCGTEKVKRNPLSDPRPNQ